MECFYRVAHDNRISAWRQGKSHHMDWIRSYYEQPLRGRENQVIVVGVRETGEETVLFCTSDRNDYLSGHTMDGQRVEIAWCREGGGDVLLRSLSSDHINRP